MMSISLNRTGIEIQGPIGNRSHRLDISACPLQQIYSSVTSATDGTGTLCTIIACCVNTMVEYGENTLIQMAATEPGVVATISPF